jgi:GT2 family glycosyltransferase
MERPTARGKFLFAGTEKLWVRGVRYAPRSLADGALPPRHVVRADFAELAGRGADAVHVCGAPPRWLLDLAHDAGLRVMVGLSWPHHDCFLDVHDRARQVRRRVRADVCALAGHPALLCYAIGDGIPASIVRWLGERRVERFLRGLARIVRREDPGALVTYVNRPSTEYLQLSFLDLACFDVDLGSPDGLEAYLGRLQNLADDRPLLMAGFGPAAQLPDGELRDRVVAAFEAGCCGTFVDVLAVMETMYAQVPFGPERADRDGGGPGDAGCPAFPRISVVVCSYNGSRTIRDTLEGLARVDYPDFEVIVVDDGSTDRVSAIASEYDVRLIRTENRGLSNARNTGCEAATGEIVAYVDDDAWPDPDWLRFLAIAYRRGDLVGVGGPNLPPPGDGPIADCVANAPGGPVHVLLDDRLAEHIPGCNMSFRRTALLAVGGFDPTYRVAGDDVDLCWRLQERGGLIGFAPAAVVWHHRRNSVRTYWKQQKGYGKAEALLERKWPERYNANGHLSWQGRLYGRGWTLSLDHLGGRIYRGMWNTAPFQSLYQRTPSTWLSLPLMPEWLLGAGLLAALSLLGLGWRPLLQVALPLLLVAAALPIAQAVLSASRARFTSGTTWMDRAWRYSLTAIMHVMQPLARLVGRIQHGLVPWRRRGPDQKLWRMGTRSSSWRPSWKAAEARLEALHAALRSLGAIAWRGGDWDDWDLSVRGGFLGEARLRMGVEEHGGGCQLLRFRSWASVPAGAVWVCSALVALGVSAFAAGAPFVGGLVLAGAGALMGTAAVHAARAMAALDLARPAAESEASITMAAAPAAAVVPAVPAVLWPGAALPLEHAAGKER